MKPVIESLSSMERVPIELLLLADPSEKRIRHYLQTGVSYVLRLRHEAVGVMVLTKRENLVEIENVAIQETHQRKGYGKLLLLHAEREAIRWGSKRLIIRTGNSSLGQITLYKKMGFEWRQTIENHFLRNYADPIYENGIQCKHQLLFEKELVFKLS